MKTPLPPPRNVIIDSDGRMTREWYLFFFNLLSRTGTLELVSPPGEVLIGTNWKLIEDGNDLKLQIDKGAGFVDTGVTWPYAEY